MPGQLHLRLLVAASVLAVGSSADARVDGVPYLDNETIGLFRSVRTALAGPPDQFDTTYWAPESMDSLFQGMVNFNRYFTALSAYAVAAASQNVPAYRAPYVDAIDDSVQRIVSQRCWKEWLELYGKDPLYPGNIMFKGHLVFMMGLYQWLSNDRKYEKVVTLTASDGKTFKTDIRTLTESIAKEASGAVDAAGEHTFSVCCEPGMVFVVCNTPHRLHYYLYDRMYGTSHAGTNEAWLGWVRKKMLDENKQLFFETYMPELAPPKATPDLSGIYNGVAIIMIDVMDHEWAKSLYQRFKTTFVVEDPKDPSTATIFDKTGDDFFIARIKAFLATGIGMALARTFDDPGLYDKLNNGFEGFFGPATWSPDGTLFEHTGAGIPRVFQNMLPLLARSLAPDRSLRHLVRRPWSEADFKRPHVASVSNDKAFVNQAHYDAGTNRLTVTLNGGKATTEKTDLVVASLDPTTTYKVERNGEPFSAWSVAGARLTIHTGALSEQEETYTVTGPTADGCGCQTGSAPCSGLAGVLLGLALPILAVRRRRRGGRRQSS